MIIYHRRPEGQSMRADRNASHTMYAEWKADRQRALDNRSRFEVQIDTLYQKANTNDSVYFGLSDRIKTREQVQMPIAGEGAVTFFSIASTVTRPLAKLAPFPFFPITSMFSIAEMVAREKSGITN